VRAGRGETRWACEGGHLFLVEKGHGASGMRGLGCLDWKGIVSALPWSARCQQLEQPFLPAGKQLQRTCSAVWPQQLEQPCLPGGKETERTCTAVWPLKQLNIIAACSAGSPCCSGVKSSGWVLGLRTGQMHLQQSEAGWKGMQLQ
jgi:hypothetical protein